MINIGQNASILGGIKADGDGCPVKYPGLIMSSRPATEVSIRNA